ncbi:MAG: serine hydrolase, partial [Myxococcota bacterium]
PSPNLRTPDQALLYPGVALIEMTNVSVGRGTDTPFELVGAPWADEGLAEHLRARRLAGLAVEPAVFVPRSGPYAGTRCRGVRLRVERGGAIEAMALGHALIDALRSLYPADFRPQGILTLVGHRPTYEAMIGGKSLREVEQISSEARAAYRKRRAPVLLYR